MTFLEKIRNLFGSPAWRIEMSHIRAKEIIERNNAQRWFYYALIERKKRWHVFRPSLWIRDNVAAKALIFETGCGCGLNLIWFGQKGFSRLHGSDIDGEAVNAGKELAVHAGLEISLWRDDALNPIEVPREVDVLLALNWTYHVERFDLAAFVRLYKHAVKDGGLIIFDVIDSSYDHVPNNQYLTSDWNKPVAERGPTEYKKRYSNELVRRIMHEQGFYVVWSISKKEIVPRIVYIVRKSGKQVPGI